MAEFSGLKNLLITQNGHNKMMNIYDNSEEGQLRYQLEKIKYELEQNWSNLRIRFSLIDKMYSVYNKFIFSEGYKYRPTLLKWGELLTPIEKNIWEDIVYYHLPMFPQYPAGGFYLDFADPVSKICIEADGAKYHKNRRGEDKKRDLTLQKSGWHIFRIQGRESYRDTLQYDTATEDDVEIWLRQHGEAVIASLAKIIYGMPNNIMEKEQAEACLINHSNTWRPA